MASRSKEAVDRITVLEDEGIYTNGELASFFKTTANSLAVSRCLGRLEGLPVIRIGARVRFRGADVKQWLRAHTDPTGSTAPQSPRKPSAGRPRKKRKAAR